MTPSGLRPSEGRFHRKASPPGFITRVLARDEFIERDRAVASPQTAGRPKVGNAAFGRNAGAGEGYDDRGSRDHLAELLHATAKVRSDHGATIQMVWPCPL